jgi:hypothetical protein
MLLDISQSFQNLIFPNLGCTWIFSHVGGYCNERFYRRQNTLTVLHPHQIIIWLLLRLLLHHLSRCLGNVLARNCYHEWLNGLVGYDSSDLAILWEDTKPHYLKYGNHDNGNDKVGANLKIKLLLYTFANL